MGKDIIEYSKGVVRGDRFEFTIKYNMEERINKNGRTQYSIDKNRQQISSWTGSNSQFSMQEQIL